MSNRGRARLGCLLFLLILAVAGYYSVDAGSIVIKRWRLADEMRAQAGFAPSIDDAAIRRRLYRRIESLDLPDEARSNLRIRRTIRPREIVISTSYAVTWVLPFATIPDTLEIEHRGPI